MMLSSPLVPGSLLSVLMHWKIVRLHVKRIINTAQISQSKGLDKQPVRVSRHHSQALDGLCFKIQRQDYVGEKYLC